MASVMDWISIDSFVLFGTFDVYMFGVRFCIRYHICWFFTVPIILLIMWLLPLNKGWWILQFKDTDHNISEIFTTFKHSLYMYLYNVDVWKLYHLKVQEVKYQIWEYQKPKLYIKLSTGPFPYKGLIMFIFFKSKYSLIIGHIITKFCLCIDIDMI